MREHSPVDRRRSLVGLFWAIAWCGLVLAAIPFLSPLFPDGSQDAPPTTEIDIGDLVVGQPRIIELSSTRPLIVLRANRVQRDSLVRLDAEVWDRTIRSEIDEAGVFAYWGLSTGKFGGCRLAHYAPGRSRLDAAGKGSRWLGGYWAAGCDASYDYAGRAIKSREYSYSGHVARTPSLRSPEIEFVGADRIAVTID
jgi:hypothetical protein